MNIRTKTYVAGDWDHDHDAIEKLYEWNKDIRLDLHFDNAHDVVQSRDTSLNCSIKKSLKTRLDISKNFVLIVGNYTNSVTAGKCSYCGSYDAYHATCHRNLYMNFDSYIEYECKQAKDAKMNILVLYNSTKVNKELCPLYVRYTGIHIPMKSIFLGNYVWDFQKVKNGFDSINYAGFFV